MTSIIFNNDVQIIRRSVTSICWPVPSRQLALTEANP